MAKGVEHRLSVRLKELSIKKLLNESDLHLLSQKIAQLVRKLLIQSGPTCKTWLNSLKPGLH